MTGNNINQERKMYKGRVEILDCQKKPNENVNFQIKM